MKRLLCYNDLALSGNYMWEREPNEETIDRGDLFYLGHPETEQIFSGYGLTTVPGRNDHFAGLLMVDRPRTADPEWLQTIYNTFGECRPYDDDRHWRTRARLPNEN